MQNKKSSNPIRVICPGCKGRFHQLTEKFDPRGPCLGNMLTLAPEYRASNINWTSFPENDSTCFANIRCPECGAEYTDHDGKLKTLDGPVPPPPHELIKVQDEVADFDNLPQLYPEGLNFLDSVKQYMEDNPDDDWLKVWQSVPNPYPGPRALKTGIYWLQHGKRKQGRPPKGATG